MHKLISYILILFLPLSFFQSAEISSVGAELKEFESSSTLKQNLSLQNPSLIESIVLLPEESFDQFEASQMISRIDRLPHSVLSRAVEEGIIIRFFTGLLTDFPTTEHLRGLNPRGYENHKTTWDQVPGIGGQEIVLVKIGHSEKGMGHGSLNLELHELAHSLDHFVFGEVRYDLRFLTIWNKEAQSLFPDNNYFLQYPEEYFAETVAMFYYSEESRKKLKNKAPLTFSYIVNITRNP